MTLLKAPFPWFGGKSRVADVVWRAFGDVPNYVEPFAGSLAVLLARPGGPGKVETVNDLDCYLANFWRALALDPEGVAKACDWPVNEADLSARHQWLVDQAGFRERMKTEPDFYDVKIAGWWVWGLCAWIGSGWCSEKKYRDGTAGRGVNRQLPHLSTAGQGVNRQLPHLGDAGRGVNRTSVDLSALALRLRRVRVACGDWKRVLGTSVTTNCHKDNMLTGVLLDPPYTDGAIDYATGSRISADVSAWAREHGDDKRLRIAICGYEGEHDLPGWTEHAWKAAGGFSSQKKGGDNGNKHRERVWFSPHCLPIDTQKLLEAAQ